MGKYDFDTVIDRRGTGSLKWRCDADELPMWVADMDFPTAPEISEVLTKIAARGIYGYNVVSTEWEDSYRNWWSRRHALSMERGELLFVKGIVPAISSMIRSFTEPGEKVLIQPPVYNCFFSTILENDRGIAENPLIVDESLNCRMDFEDLDRKLSDPGVRLFILCNPQNPCGRIWNKEELARVGELAERHGVTVISDEIHCDLTDPQISYQPFAAVNEVCRKNSLTCLAPSKAFNLAGIQTAAVYSANKELLKRAEKGFDTDEVSEAGSFAVPAAVAAFSYGEDWLNELNGYIFENKRIVKEFLSKELPEVKVMPSEATYLLWLDVRSLPGQGRGFAEHLRKKAGLWLAAGESYGENGKGFLRMNIACPASLVREGLKRLKKGAESFSKG